MIVPLQDPHRQYVAMKNDLDSAVSRTLSSGRYLMGAMMQGFETAFAKYCGVPHLVSVGNGTDALELALLAAEAKGRDVITVANAGGYTTTACRIIEARPVYVDIDPSTLLLSIPAAISAVTAETAVIVVTHLYGRMADVNLLRSALKEIGREDIRIVEDCAQAHGGIKEGQRAGSFGDFSTFSFYPTKNLGAMGDAGAIACRGESAYQKLLQLRQYGWKERYKSEVPYARNSRLDELQAAILLAKLPHLDRWNAQRREVVQRYRSAAPASFTAWFQDSPSFVAHLAVTCHPEREKVRRILSEAGIASDIHYPILDCDQPSQRGLPMVVHDLSGTRKAVAEILTLPCFPELTDGESDRVAKCLSKIG